jgi:hypothetical protein
MKKNLLSRSTRLIRRFQCVLIFLSISVTCISQNAGISDPGAIPLTGPPNTSAGLDVNFTNKGLLIPRVALTGAANATPLNPIATPVAGMLVYNTATTADVIPGFYVNDGLKWVTGLQKGTAIGDMQYWDGAAWKIIPVGLPGQKLKLVAGIPTWAP